MGKNDVLRSSRFMLEMSMNGRRAQVNAIIERFAESARRSHALSDGGLRDLISSTGLRVFVIWMTNFSDEMIGRREHRRRLDAQRAEMSGDRQLLMLVGEVEKGRCDVTFSVGAGRDFVGAGELLPRVLPADAREGDMLLVTISRPVCRVCGCTAERKCEAGCFWVKPNLCSGCVPARRRRVKREE